MPHFEVIFNECDKQVMFRSSGSCADLNPTDHISSTDASHLRYSKQALNTTIVLFTTATLLAREEEGLCQGSVTYGSQTMCGSIDGCSWLTDESLIK